MIVMDAQDWDARYGGSELIWGSGPNRFLVEEIGDSVPGAALDVACGEGRNAIWLAEKGWRVTGVDFSRVALDKAGAMAVERGVQVEWVQADLGEWEPSGVFDLVVVMYLHLPVDLRRQIFTRLAAAVAEGGIMLVVGHHRANLLEGHGGPQDAAVLYTPEEVSAELVGLTIERAERVTRIVDTDGGQKSAVDALVRGRRSPGPG